MTITSGRLYNLTSSIFICMLFVLAYSPLVAQDAGVRRNDLDARRGYQDLQELHDIRFGGCNQTTPEQLLGIIQSRQSQTSITRKLTEYFYTNLKQNPSTPGSMMTTIERHFNDVQEAIRYYIPQTAQDDSAALEIYLQQNGFHNASITFSFDYERDSEQNILTFHVNEGGRAQVDTVAYIGMDSVDPLVFKDATGRRQILKGTPFSEVAMELEAREVIAVLQNNGYFRATYDPPLVITSSDGLKDSIIVKVKPGRRVRVAQIVFDENLNNQPSVNESTRRSQLDFEEGEWYSRKRIDASRANLMSIGAFELVSIDTLSAELLDSAGSSISDSNIALRVFSKNDRVYDVGANLMLFQTAIDNFLNGGVGITAQYKNLFGGAQVASVTLQYILQDLSRVFQDQNIETEALASIVLAWPNITRVYGNRVGLQTNTYYSLRTLVYPFKMESFGVSGRSPINLMSHTFFNGIDFNLGIERQVPRDFENALDEALSEANSAQDTAFILSTLNQFIVLDNYLKTSGNFFTGVYAGVSLRGEHRDNLTNPTKGTFTNLSAEIGLGAGQFIRAQFFNTTAERIAPLTVFATKVRVGHIALLDFTRNSLEDTNTYVPLERQFFAGGAASIRSYPSRFLHDPHSGVIVNPDTSGEGDPLNDERILSNVVGSGSLVELGVELRFGFARPRGIDDLWASMIERSGVTLFADYGNTFNRLTPDLYGTMQLQDLWLGSVLAMGIGYRFDTPVGPFRIDYATSVYDPLRTEGTWAFSKRENALGFSNWQLSIGLGHAF